MNLEIVQAMSANPLVTVVFVASIPLLMASIGARSMGENLLSSIQKPMARAILLAMLGLFVFRNLPVTDQIFTVRGSLFN